MMRSLAWLLLLAAACAQTAPNTAVAKQQLLWQKLESTINDVDHSLDGVLGETIYDRLNVVSSPLYFKKLSIDLRYSPLFK